MIPRKLWCVDLVVVLALAGALLLPATLSAQAGSYTFVNIDYPGAYLTIPEAVNDNGAVVGYYLDTQYGNYHGFLYSGGTYTPLMIRRVQPLPRGLITRRDHGSG